MVPTRSLLLAVLSVGPAAAAEFPETLLGWFIEPTGHNYSERVDAAVAESPLNVVTRASATVGAKSLGQKIPGNMVVGVFAPRFAIRSLAAGVAAGSEAPLRLYITENADGTATLSYKTASHVFAPYAAEGGQELSALATELDTALEQIAEQAIRQQD